MPKHGRAKGDATDSPPLSAASHSVEEHFALPILLADGTVSTSLMRVRGRPRVHHTAHAITVEGKSFLAVIGGHRCEVIPNICITAPTKEELLLNDVMTLPLPLADREFDVTRLPTKICGHASVVLSASNIAIFGGWTPDGILCSILVLTAVVDEGKCTFRFDKRATNSCLPRILHTAVTVAKGSDEIVVVFCGLEHKDDVIAMSNALEVFSGSLHRLSTEVDSTPPPPRASCASSALPGGRAVYYGGVGEHGEILSDLWLLTVSSISQGSAALVWREVQRTTGFPRVGHTLQWFKGCLVVVGGFHDARCTMPPDEFVLEIGEDGAAKPLCYSSGAALAWHRLVRYEDRLIIFGGVAGREEFSRRLKTLFPAYRVTTSETLDSNHSRVIRVTSGRVHLPTIPPFTLPLSLAAVVAIAGATAIMHLYPTPPVDLLRLGCLSQTAAETFSGSLRLLRSAAEGMAADFKHTARAAAQSLSPLLDDKASLALRQLKANRFSPGFLRIASSPSPAPEPHIIVHELVDDPVEDTRDVPDGDEPSPSQPSSPLPNRTESDDDRRSTPLRMDSFVVVPNPPPAITPPVGGSPANFTPGSCDSIASAVHFPTTRSSTLLRIKAMVNGRCVQFTAPPEARFSEFAATLWANIAPLLPHLQPPGDVDLLPQLLQSLSLTWMDEDNEEMSLLCDAHYKNFIDHCLEQSRPGGKVVARPVHSVTPPLVCASGQGNDGGGGSGGGSNTSSPTAKGVPHGSITRWKKGRLIGRGSYGSVYAAIDNDTGKIFAVKQIALPPDSGGNAKWDQELQSFQREIDLLQSLTHPNIVRLLGTQRVSGSVYIFMEYMAEGSLAAMARQYGSRTKGLDCVVLQGYTVQILRGLEYLHSHSILHRDIKGDNILCDSNGTVKLGDFGLSKKLVEVASGLNSGLKGTVLFLAPEVIQHQRYSVASDMWALGCTMIEISTGNPPWSEKNFQHEIHVAYYIGQSGESPLIPSTLPSVAQQFIGQCLQIDPAMRPTASELLKHPYLTSQLEADTIDSLRSEQSAYTSVTYTSTEISPPPSEVLDKILHETQHSVLHTPLHTPSKHYTP